MSFTERTILKVFFRILEKFSMKLMGKFLYSFHETEFINGRGKRVRPYLSNG